MTKKQHQLPAFGRIRVIVDVDGDERRIVSEFQQKHLPEWLVTMAGLVTTPLVHGEEGALQCREIFRVASGNDQTLMCCLCAMWISLYGPGSVPGMGLTLDNLLTVKGGVMTVHVSADQCRWRYQLSGTGGRQGGSRTVPDLDFVTIGNA